MASSRKSPRTEDASALADALAACLDRHLSSGQQLTVGLSGGVDSVVLLHALSSLERSSPGRFELTALHVHHGLSLNADRWEDFCRTFCERLGIAFFCVHVRVERGSRDGLEAAARRVRHAVFARQDADWIALAQHRDDQAETLLFKLLRGSGLAGAAGMRECNGRLLRPLLTVGRSDIEAYARWHGLSWIEDESNADVRHSRNFLRHGILPGLIGRFPAAVKNLAGAAARFAEAADLLDELARIDLGGESDFPVDAATLAALDDARARNVLRYLLAQRQVMIPSEARLNETLRQMREAARDRHPALRFGGHRLVRRRGLIYLEPADGGDSDESC
jgi:tRNA(Ile)-lysidine synthase